MIELNNAGKSFNGKWAVNRLTCRVERGEIFAILGPNGAGKTTTIKMMTGILKPTEGSILINRYNIVNEPERAKAAFGYIPDCSYLYEKLTGKEFLLFVSSLYRVKKDEALQRAKRLMETMGITHVAEELIENYSYGMRQRLIFASAFIHRPEVLIIDEPFVGLDPYGIRMIKRNLKEFSHHGGTVFLATHSLYIVEELCDRVGIMDKSTLITIKNRKDIRNTEGGLEGLFIQHTS